MPLSIKVKVGLSSRILSTFMNLMRLLITHLYLSVKLARMMFYKVHINLNLSQG